MLNRLFSRKKNDLQDQQGDGWLMPRSGGELLRTPYRQEVIKSLWDLTSLTRPVFVEYLQRPLERYAELVQQLPASENHHHAYAGGMLDHGLEVMNYALRIRQQHLLPPGAAPEDQLASGERWTIAVAYGALLHDAAKVLVDLDICLEGGRIWRLWQGRIPGPYRVQYRKGRDYQLHQVTNGLLCEPILGSQVLGWLYEDPVVFSQLMYTITGYGAESGIIGEIVAQADRASVASALGGDPAKALKAPVESLQRKLVDALRYLVKEQLVLNTPRAPAYLTEDALWVVAPSVPNQLKACLLQHGVPGVPSKTTRMYDEMQAHGLILEANDGKSVWRGEVSIGEWKATLSFLRVPPEVIWGPGETRPSTLAGSLVVIGTEAKSEARSSITEVHVKEQAAETIDDAIPPVSSSKGDADSSLPCGEEQGATAYLVGEPTAKCKPNPSSTVVDVDEMISLISGKEKGENLTDRNEEVGYHVEILHDEKSTGTTEAVGTEDYGERFLQWLKEGIESHQIVINHTKALVHVVDDAYFLVSPGIFKRFCTLAYGSEKPWNKVQQRFQNLGLHQKPSGDRNIVEVEVRGPNRKGNVLKGYMLKPDCGLTPHLQNNVFLSLKGEAE
ncbi:MobH family relaxase [Billgrantia ethanolica]|uniref:DNA-binding domain-containing protein n=1 Tax=Billgrantia ethanolica TaxID=2733486 RepID=A0ABS9A9G1_9GAMM|nr:MobH family relaxase [Halomonas ethanolica]MCE8005275.1 DNA-binding domain-containing protein [Halomonas ethanolica]